MAAMTWESRTAWIEFTWRDETPQVCAHVLTRVVPALDEVRNGASRKWISGGDASWGQMLACGPVCPMATEGRGRRGSGGKGWTSVDGI